MWPCILGAGRKPELTMSFSEYDPAPRKPRGVIDVGMANPSAIALHPLVNSTLATKASTLSGDSRGTEDCIEEGDKGLDGGIVSGRMKSKAVRTCHKVPVAPGPTRVWPSG